MKGLLLVDKPAGITSHDVVSVVRRAARTRRVGHAGTLDPFATGLLVVAVGTATRLLPYLADEPKVYDATIAFGVETNTDDGTGISVRTADLPDLSRLADAIATLTGDLAQIPPAFSAKQIDGQRAYAVARRGGALDLPPVSIRVDRWTVLAVRADAIDVRIVCGGGTYIRALARDLGRALDSAAHCAVLRRISSGAATIDHATPLADLTPGAVADAAIALQPALPYLEPMSREQLDEVGLKALSYGRTVAATQPGARAVLLRDNDVVAIADRVVDQAGGDRWQPRLVLLNEPSRTASNLSTDRADASAHT